MKLENGAACEVVSGLIIEYIDGELDDRTAELVERHIEVCADCRKLYCDLRAVCRAAADSAFCVPDELHTRVMAAVRAEKSARRRTKLMRRVSAYAGVGIAAMLCIIIGVAAIFNSLGKNADLFAGFSEKLSNEETGRLTMFQYSFNRIASPEDDDLLLEATGLDAGTDEYECWQYDGRPADSNMAELESKSLTPPDAADAAPPACDSAGSLPDIILLSGEWELFANGKPIKLTLCPDHTFSLVDTGGNSVAGNYTVSNDVISFSYPGGAAGYKYCLDSSGLGLSHVSGVDIIK